MFRMGQCHTENLAVKYSFLFGGVVGKLSATDHASHMMQLALAANGVMGIDFSREVTRQL